jgi:hypothetical protein
MSFDLKDPYDSATWWHQLLRCKNCGAIQEYDYESPFAEGSDDYFHAYAQRAKKSGWLVTEKSPKAEWIVLCPKCSSQA